MKDNNTPLSLKFQNIEFLRFLFSIIIIIFHITNYSPLKSIFMQEGFNCRSSYLVVEFFFIISGFFLYRTFKYKNQTFGNFTVKKIIRLLPPVIFLNILFILSTHLNYVYLTDLCTSTMDILLLNNLGLTDCHFKFHWFVSVYFWTAVFYYYLLKNYAQKNVNLIIFLLIYFSLTLNLNEGNFGLNILYTYKGFLNGAVLRGIAGIGLGYFTGILFDKISINTEKFNSLKSFTVFSTIEILLSLFLIKRLLFETTIISNKITVLTIVAFIGLFLLFLLKKGMVSRLFENKYLAFFGKFTYSIYIMHYFAFIVLGETLWKTPYFILHTNLCILISIISCTLFGAVTYYLIEKPAVKYLNKLI